MSYVFYPDTSQPWVFEITEPIQETYTTAEANTVIQDNGDRLTVAYPAMAEGAYFTVYQSLSDGLSLGDETILSFQVKLNPVPALFVAVSFFAEDIDGKKRTYGISRKDIGKVQMYNADACEEDKDFNPTYVVKIGFEFENLSTEHDITFSMGSLGFLSITPPTYADPQDVVRFLGLRTNKAAPLILTISSYPSYDYICDLVTQAESFIDQQTHTSWRENREVDEIHNAPFASLPGIGYAGIWAGFTESFAGGDYFLKGYPVTLNRQNVRPFDYSKGDRVLVRQFGTQWVEVPEENIWIDETKGIIFIKKWFFQKEDSVKVTYRWGQKSVPEDIKMCAKLIACKHIVMTDWYRAKFPLSPEFDPLKSETVNNWTWQIKDILKGHQQDLAIGFF